MADDIDSFLSGYASEVKTLGQAVRAMIVRAVPAAKEKLHPGWKVIAYRTDHVVCSIAPHQRWVNVQFADGTSLPDPQGRLQGTGKRMRHVKITQQEEIDAGLEALILASAQLT